MRTDELQRGLRTLADGVGPRLDGDAHAAVVAAGRRRRRRRIVLRGVVAVALMGIAAGAIAAVSTHDQSTHIEAVKATPLRAAAETTTRSGTALVEIALHQSNGDVNFTGRVDFRNSTGALSGTTAAPSAQVRSGRALLVEARWIGGTNFLRIGMTGSGFGQWARFRVSSSLGGDNSRPLFVALPDVSSLLQAFDVVPDAAVTIGRERLNGVPVVHQRVTSTSKAASAAFQRTLFGPRDGTGPIMLDYWVDAHRRLVQVTIRQAELVNGQTTPFEETMRLSHFGAPVSVEAPSDVAPGELTSGDPEPAGPWHRRTDGVVDGVHWQYGEAPATNGGTCPSFVFDPPLDDDPQGSGCGPPIDVFRALFPINVPSQGHSTAGDYDVVAGVAASDVTDLRAVRADGSTTPVALGPGRTFVIVTRGSSAHVSRLEAREGDTKIRCESKQFYFCTR